MKTKILTCLFLIGSSWLAGCEYYTSRPFPVQVPAEQKTVDGNQGSHESQGVRDEVIAPQTTNEKANEPQGEITGPQVAPEKPEAIPETPQPAFPPDPKAPVGANIPAVPAPEVMSPRARKLPEPAPIASKPRLIPDLQTVPLEAMGGEGGDETKMTCDKDQAITGLIARHPDISPVDFLDSLDHIECTDIHQIVSGTGNPSMKSFGDGPSDDIGLQASPRALGLKFALTGYAVFPCRSWDQGPVVVCGLRPFAMPLTSEGVVNDPVWLSPVMGRKSAGLQNDEALREAAANHTNAWIDGETYVANCPEGYVLTGFDGRTGGALHQLAGVCKPVVVSKGN